MNKHRFAFDTIKLWVKPWEVTEDVFEEGKPNRKKQFLEIIEELVEKATPKKPKESDHAPYHTFCGSCGGLVFDSHNYCSKCGQALDWSNDDE